MHSFPVGIFSLPTCLQILSLNYAFHIYNMICLHDAVSESVHVDPHSCKERFLGTCLYIPFESGAELQKASPDVQRVIYEV